MGHTKCCVLLLNGWELQQPWQPQGVGEERMQQFVRNVRARIGISESRPEDLVMALQEEVLNVANAIHANRIMQVAAQLRAFLFDGIQYRR
jgi:anti-sigma regulatory factor (Ser/Thr protein kinase)